MGLYIPNPLIFRNGGYIKSFKGRANVGKIFKSTVGGLKTLTYSFSIFFSPFSFPHISMRGGNEKGEKKMEWKSIEMLTNFLFPSLISPPFNVGRNEGREEKIGYKMMSSRTTLIFH